mmetsp:Transcript_23270/g.64993  ORF Transcript_23270/g.64993 Transcript_23270/m.64993 type:complete len:212 (+) Transcript_23270:301-936(+)
MHENCAAVLSRDFDEVSNALEMCRQGLAGVIAVVDTRIIVALDERRELALVGGDDRDHMRHALLAQCRAILVEGLPAANPQSWHDLVENEQLLRQRSMFDGLVSERFWRDPRSRCSGGDSSACGFDLLLAACIRRGLPQHGQGGLQSAASRVRFEAACLFLQSQDELQDAQVDAAVRTATAAEDVSRGRPLARDFGGRFAPWPCPYARRPG